MTSDRIQKRIERLLDEAEEAADGGDWPLSAARSREALALSEQNPDAAALLQAAEQMLAAEIGPVTESPSKEDARIPAAMPESFANGRYQVKRFLGEGGK